ncbi:MAG: LytTR family transcriptional regulator DNA-binding domain-containing protein [Lachnospiraceae bacterium]|nr:LytTR family transcriptional regulator DNA-binding domain-containing protein [Lachnospiraceae bacterium]
MKVTIHQIPGAEEEVSVTYDALTPDVERVLEFLQGHCMTLTGKADEETVQVPAGDILYIESVDDRTFAYTEKAVVRLGQSLTALSQMLDDIRFFRCSKSMILNIDKIERLRSLPSNRIDATMRGGEHILISRTYASDLRSRLKKGGARRGERTEWQQEPG